MKTIASLAFVASLVAGTVHAGGFVAPVTEPAPAPIISPVMAPVSGWTGFYAGGQYGKGRGDLSFGTTEQETDFDAYGVHGGYMHGVGQFVLGGELDYNRLDIDTIDERGDLTRLRARAGYHLGRFLPYATLGAARLSADIGEFSISENAVTYGIGADFKVTERFTVGAEYTRQDFNDLDGIDNLDLDTDMVQLRASFRF